jgi:hypothetical protein
MELILALITTILIVPVMFFSAVKVMDMLPIERGGTQEAIIMVFLSIGCFFASFKIGLIVFDYLI